MILPDYDTIEEKFEGALNDLREITPTYESVDDLESELEEAEFVKAFRRLMRHINVLQSFTQFDWDDLDIDEQEFENYKGKYLNIRERVEQENEKQKTSILNDIDFELELIHRDRINVAYILVLLSQLKDSKATEAKILRQTIIDLLGGEVTLRSKRELIEKFIEENLPTIKDSDRIEDEFEQYWQEQKVMALGKLCDDENLDKDQFKALIDAYIFSGKEPIKDDVIKCLANRPSILHARTIGDRIIKKMQTFIEVFVRGMVA